VRFCRCRCSSVCLSVLVVGLDGYVREGGRERGREGKREGGRTGRREGEGEGYRDGMGEGVSKRCYNSGQRSIGRIAGDGLTGTGEVCRIA